jgi:hypothetical protein
VDIGGRGRAFTGLFLGIVMPEDRPAGEWLQGEPSNAKHNEWAAFKHYR